MSYQPTQDDIRCANCREWYHKALRSCPLCDAPNVPTVSPVVLAPVAVIVPQPAVYEHPAAPFTDRHTRRTAIVAASCVCVVLLIWAVARILVIREEQRQLREIVSTTRQMFGDIDKQIDKMHSAPSGQTLTYEKFSRVQVGMSYNEVAAIFGTPGKVTYQDDANGMIMIDWVSGDSMAHASCTFKGGVLSERNWMDFR